MSNEVRELYDNNFYAGKNGAYVAGIIVAPFILNLFPGIKTVVDIGCGAGGWLAAFADFGKVVAGYDYGAGVEENLLIPKSCFSNVDISNPLHLDSRYDLAISLEVAEHIDESKADIFIETLCNISDIILFSAAIPGQGGTNHVNCQWPTYWVRKFAANNFLALDILRPIFWNMQSIAVWYRQNMILFINESSNYDHQILCKYSSFNCLPIVHPQLDRHA